MREIKSSMKQLERESKENNLYSRYKPIRKTVKERNMNVHENLSEALRENPRVSIAKFSRADFKRGLQVEEGEHPFPVLAKLGPYKVDNVLYGAKNYYWCSCGMSKKQPFCDYSHKGTLFKGVKFSIDQKIDNKTMYLCGCKLTKNAPFCDGETCLGLLSEQEPSE